ncbi:hypothetical protein [Pseudoxanthomonas daejeonensis]|uniref:Ankyrin repeat domain-containing protein n=1 Tax=Pseudoxanthomonas daejeonensis TaxID=266062 RepID=A0ABQ6Z9K8_9GAMM|nr:hypothetical protein [Pseudoxanthomonas daejeonensis]KAF1696011.1 hypothetical protein CSC65_05810 [Pseudoxanthomonas daejeonensis]
MKCQDFYSQYDSSGWTSEMKSEVRLGIEQVMAQAEKESALQARQRNESWEHIIHWLVYAEWGVVPVGYVFPFGPDWLIDACRGGSDELACRLLNDGMDPDFRMPGRWTARRYAKENRAFLPMTWAWLERDLLGKLAAKQRKRSWAGGTFTERRAI